MTATNSVTETTRLATLERYDILDTQPEAVFDDIAKLARDLMGATASMVCFIDKDRQWFISGAGVVIVSMIFGILLTKISWQKKKRWNEL